MVRPVSASIPVTLGYRQKARFDPNYIHRGIDYGCPSGTKVVATIGGKVVHAGTGGMGSAFGVHVVLETNGIFHIYAHLSRADVKKGQTVKAGQQVGLSGATGNVTGAHLHYGEFTRYHYLADRKPQFIDATAVKPNTTTAGKPVTGKVKYTVTATLLNGRGGPGTDYKVLAQRKKGFTFTATRQSGDWVMASKVWYHTAYLKKVTTSTPSKPSPAPKTAPKATALRIGTWNLALITARPKLNNRLNRISRQVRKRNLDILAVQERPQNPGKQLDPRLGHLTVRVGGKARYIYFREGTKVHGSATWDPMPKNKAVTKWVTSACVTIPGHDKQFFVNCHPISGPAYSEHREKWARKVIMEAFNRAAKHGLGPEDIIFLGDFNGPEFAKVAAECGFVRVRKHAKKANALTRTFNAWGKKTTEAGGQFDYILVHNSRAGDITLAATISTPKASDHNLVLTEIQR